MLTSKTTMDVRFAQYLDTLNTKNNHSNRLTDDGWIQFLMDHRQWLRDRPKTKIVKINETLMGKYQYNIRDFLGAQNDCRADCEQAFRIMNRLDSDMKFNLDLRYVYVPYVSDVTDLRKSYNTYKKQMANSGLDVTTL